MSKTKIGTVDCVKALVEKFPSTNQKDWKRRQKITIGEYGRTVRIFENVKTKQTIKTNFFSSFNPIEIEDITGLDLFGILKSLLEKPEYGYEAKSFEGDEVRTYDLINELEGRAYFAKLPQVALHDDEEDEKKVTGHEDVDFENCEIIALTKDTITLWAGGDWQEPITFSMTFKNGLLYYNNDATEKGESDGMTVRQLLKTLYGTEHPEQLKGRTYCSWEGGEVI